MTAAGYDFHPEAEIDVDAIWEFIAEDSQLAADGMIKPLRRLSRRSFHFPTRATAALISLPDRCVSPMLETTS